MCPPLFLGEQRSLRDHQCQSPLNTPAPHPVPHSNALRSALQQPILWNSYLSAEIRLLPFRQGNRGRWEVGQGEWLPPLLWASVTGLRPHSCLQPGSTICPLPCLVAPLPRGLGLCPRPTSMEDPFPANGKYQGVFVIITIGVSFQRFCPCLSW